MAQTLDNSLKKQGIGLLAGLTLQYIFGTITTNFVKFPESGDSGQFWQFAWSQIPAAIHIILGIFLLVGSSALIVRAFKSHDRNWKRVSVIGFLAILLSAYSGAQFVSSQNDVYSFMMALGFIIALSDYGFGIYLSK